MVGRFPGAVTLRDFWDNLCQGRETITFFSDDEMVKAGFDPGRLSNPHFVRAAGVYNNPLGFDARFFGFTPRDVELIDPQQRIFLECCWEAMETAGYDPMRYGGRAGVFAGEGITQYLFEIMVRPQYRNVSGFNFVTSNDKDYIATRVGYKLNFRGPCVTVQTACSTSLVATVLGCQSLLTHQADLILAGGATIGPFEVAGYEYQEGGILSPDGHCRSFDAAAKGTIFSSGAGVVVLKRLEEALADEDAIYAVIRGFGLNNDGGQRAGFTAPGVEGQRAVSTEAFVMSGINPETISYVECHGTATALGDPIEVKALSQAFGAFTAKRQFCAIGSVKSNIGHTDSAAGVAGLIKTALALNHRKLPPSLHYTKANPEIRFEETPFFVNASLRDWTAEGPLRAGVNSFGIGGTNAHVIVEEPPKRPATSDSRDWQLLLLSARTPTALDALTDRLRVALTEQDAPLADIAYTLQVGRHPFEHRRSLLARDRESAVRTLTTPDASGPLTFPPVSSAPKVVFLFPGQGSQHLHMARVLYQSEAAFTTAFDRCAELFAARLGQDLRELVYPRTDAAAAAAEQLQQTMFTQPVLFAIEYSLACLCEEWGITPGAMIGHSIGEYVAACLAGVLSLEDAVALVSVRGTLMQSVPPGSMLSLLLPESEALALLQRDDDLSVAAVNGPSACVVSGPTDRIDPFSARLTAKNIPNRVLKTSHAFHSAMMDPILPAFLQQVRRVKLQPPQRPYLSNLTGTWIRAEEATNPEYWIEHLRRPVRFSAAVGELVRGEGRVAFLEVGPGRALTTLVAQQCGRDPNVHAIATLSPAQDGGDDLASMLKALGQLWGAGVEPDWRGFYARERRRRVATVTSPFEREKYGSLERSAMNASAPSPTIAPASAEKRPFENWFFTVNWTRTPEPPAEPIEAGTVCLALIDDSAAAASLTGELGARGFRVIPVKEGGAFDERGDGQFTIRADAEADYETLIARLVKSDRTPARIVHAWGLLGEHAEDGVDHADRILARCFFSPLALAKALAKHLSTKPVSIAFVSSRAYDVVGDERICPALATIFGPSTTAAKEFKNLTASIVDVEMEGDRLPSDDLKLLVDELCRKVPADDAVAIRRGHRWLREFVPTAPPQADSAPRLRDGGVYLVTGGFGGLGLAAARYLAQEAHAKLVLIGRSALPPHDEWTAFLASAAADDDTAAKIRAALDIEALGGEVLACGADVADEAEMSRALAQARERFGAIHGVIHAAGVASEGIIELKQATAARAVLRPKVHGSLVLDRLLRDDALDFFLLYGSLNGVRGSAGQVDYAAANAFLDAFAWSRRRATHNRPTAIDWDRWDEVGMAVKTMEAMSARDARLIDGKEEAITHPVFTRRIVGAEHETYIVPVSADTHWIAGEHKIVGRPTMVGTSHVELVRAAYGCSEGTDLVEIRDLLFVQPVMLADGERRDVYYTLKPAKNGARDFSVWSVANGARAEHARGRIARATESSARYDVEEIFARCGNTRPPRMAEGVSTNGEPAVVQVSRRWEIFHRVADSDREAIAEIRLADVHMDDLSGYFVHPAVLDCATSYESGPVFRQMYLPLAYRRVRVLKAMSPVLYGYKRFKPTDSATPEVVSCDVVLFDDAGEPIVEVEEFTMKRVPDPAALASLIARGSAAQPQPGGERRPVAKRFGKRITTEEGIKVLASVIAAPWSAQVIVSVGEADEALAATGSVEGAAAAAAEGSGQVYARPALATPYVAPRSELETSLAEIWQAVIGIDKIGVHDDFIDLGGHSLLAIQLTSRISETFGIEFSVSEFYQEATVEGAARAILVKLTQGLQDTSIDELLESAESGTGREAAGA